MPNNYIGCYFTVEPVAVGSEILMAELGELEFESFTETETGIEAYIQKEFWDEKMLDQIEILKSNEFKINYTFKEIEQVNWNIEWEKNFEPLDVEGICHIRAPFHPKKNTQFEIIIEPKMSFGTGHHETTHMMIQHLLNIDVNGLKTLDMGCGTAILAILAEMKGAKPIDAIDIDNWCYLNSIENAERNNCSNITVYEGDANMLKDNQYDLIIANINRNILLNDMPAYVQSLNSNGIILFSGFYTEDIDAINKACVENGLEYISKLERNNWASLKYSKPNLK
jgi:ribosomal protein L11 methyltransferase